MAVPKGKISKQRGRTRFSNTYKAVAPTLSECPQCHELKTAHRVCPKCGYYDGVQVVDTQKKDKE